MPRLIFMRPVYFLTVMSLFVLSGCQTSQGMRDIFSGSKNSEELLEGDERQVSIKAEDEVSPLEQHLRARGDVDPTKINKKNRYTKNVKNSHAKEKNHFRVVRVEDEAAADALEIDTAPLDREEKQTQTMSYIQSILARHKAQQESEGTPKVAVKKTRTAKKEAVSRADVAVRAVRIGQHPGKTRIVFDVDDEVQFDTKFVDNNKTLVVSLPRTSWSAERKTKVAGESLIQGYSASTYSSGVEVEIALSAAGRLAYQKLLKPSGASGHRIVLDVVAR